MAIRPIDLFGGIYTRQSITQAPSSTKRIEALQKEREQLEADAERLGLGFLDKENPVVVSHRNIVSKIDAEIEMLQKRDGVQAPETEAAPDAEMAAQPAEAAPKQIIQRMPDQKGVYPPGTFLDIYA